MSDQDSEDRRLEEIEAYASNRDMPRPVNPLQAQTAFERRARNEDWVAHVLGMIIVLGFFIMALAGLLGYVEPPSGPSSGSRSGSSTRS